MFVADNQRRVPANVNTMILQGDDGTYYYMHRDLYDQLVILSDVYAYSEKINIMCNSVKEGASIETMPDNLKSFYDRVPWPIKAATPFLLLVSRVEELSDFNDLCGALSVMSMSVNLRRYLKVDKSLRAAVTFSLHVTEEYKPTWDRFFQENPVFGTNITMPAPAPTVAHIPTPTGTVIAVDQETGEEEEIHYTSDPAAFDFSSLGSLMDGLSFSSVSSSDDGGDDEDDGDDEYNAAAGGGSGFSALEGV